MRLKDFERLSCYINHIWIHHVTNNGIQLYSFHYDQVCMNEPYFRFALYQDSIVQYSGKRNLQGQLKKDEKLFLR